MKEIRVPFKKNFNFWTFVSIVQIVYLIFNYHDYSIFEISYMSLIFVFLNIYNIQKNREYYKKIKEYDLTQDEIRLAEEKLELEQSRILENKYLTITVNPESKLIHYFSYTNDYLSNFQRLED